jgi:fibronectin type 3 domain-containing protein
MLPNIRLNRFMAIAVSLLFCYCPQGFADDVTLAWDASESDDTVGYNIYYGNSSRNYDTPIDVGDQTSYTVTNLADGTYYFSVTAYDSAKNESIYSNEVHVVISPLPDTTPPAIGSISSSNITTSGATISWTTDEASTTQVEYGLSTAYGSTTNVDSTLRTSHTQLLSGLAPGTVYHYRVKSMDAAGNPATSGDRTFTTEASPDTTPPLIGSIRSSNITTSGATISWTTNEASTTQMEYGLSTAYGSTTNVDSTLRTLHTELLSGLAPGTLYHYRVKSMDAAGNPATSGDHTFTTEASPPDTTTLQPPLNLEGSIE